MVEPTDDEVPNEGVDENPETESSGGGRVEGLLPSLVKKALAQGVEVLTDESLRETVVAETLRRAIEKGTEVVDVTEDSVRRLVGELPVSKELGDRLLQRLDDHKSELFGLLKNEIRELTERVDMVNEIQSVLAGMTLEVNAQIRFVKNEDGGLVTKTSRTTTRKRTPARKAKTAAAKKAAKPRTKKTGN